MSEQDTAGTGRISEMAGQTGDRAREVGGQAVDKARDVAGQATDKARDQAREQVGERSDQVGEQVGSVAGDARAVSGQLREQGNESVARLVDQGAAHAQRLADYLTESGPDRILADVEDYARRQPWLMALGGLAVGLVASRVVKASSHERATDGGSESANSRSGADVSRATLSPAVAQDPHFVANVPAPDGSAGEDRG